MLRQKFAHRSRLLSVDDTGHGVYVLGDNPCALNTTTRYLVEGKMPARDLLCRAPRSPWAGFPARRSGRPSPNGSAGRCHRAPTVRTSG